MAPKLPSSGYILGLDVGGRRIGVALSSVIARIPRPLEHVIADESAISTISTITQVENVSLVVVGMPRNLNGEETAQSKTIREFTDLLSKHVTVPIVFADESLSSVRAEEMVKDKQFKGVSSDSLAACFILEEYFTSL